MQAPLTAETLVTEIKDLVILPDVAMRIAKLVDDPAASANDIANRAAASNRQQRGLWTARQDCYRQPRHHRARGTAGT